MAALNADPLEQLQAPAQDGQVDYQAAAKALKLPDDFSKYLK